VVSPARASRARRFPQRAFVGSECRGKQRRRDAHIARRAALDRETRDLLVADCLACAAQARADDAREIDCLEPARAEALRGTFDPGYFNYSLGKLQILKLRDDYKAQQGNDFSLQKFHNEVLNHGMPPIRLLREIMLKDKAKWNEVL